MTSAAPPCRAVQLRDDDRLLVAYPKSGITWLSFMLGHLMAPHTRVDFTAVVEGCILDIYVVPADRLDDAPAPRLLKSHERYDPRYPRVVYVVRDPRDVAVSYYHHQRKYGLIDLAAPLDAFVEAFVAGQCDGFGPWDANVAGWLDAADRSDRCCWIRYEDLIRDTHAQLARVAAHLGLRPGPGRLSEAVAACTASRMRALEVADTAAGRMRVTGRTDMHFVRNAEAGSWRRELPAASADRIVAAFGPTMQRCDYDCG